MTLIADSAYRWHQVKNGKPYCGAKGTFKHSSHELDVRFGQRCAACARAKFKDENPRPKHPHRWHQVGETRDRSAHHDYRCDRCGSEFSVCGALNVRQVEHVVITSRGIVPDCLEQRERNGLAVAAAVRLARVLANATWPMTSQVKRLVREYKKVAHEGYWRPNAP
jgi:hypothetical protein